MSQNDSKEAWKRVNGWWETGIIRMQPGEIDIRGYQIQELIGRISFPEMIWLMTRGELPDPDQASLLEAALVSAVDHGPQAPSIGIARMSMTCGVDLNNAMASALNALGDVHGGAGEQATRLYMDIDRRILEGVETGLAIEEALALSRETYGKMVPGFGHRFHPVDPRAVKLMELVSEMAARGVISGRFRSIALSVESTLAEKKGKLIPMNIDGATAVVFAELGFPPELARGLFCLSRSVGILSHAYEQMCQGGRNKGTTPPEFLWKYSGPEPRTIAKADSSTR